MNTAAFFDAWIGLGGNIGHVKEAMSHALQRLDHHAGCRVVAVSSLYKTPPWGKTDQPWFLNACAKVSTSLEPEALLQFCLDIEEDMKRRRLEKWGPRTLDIDLLFYENRKIFIPGRLTLPHPRTAERAFVLLPLAEISPELLLDGHTAADMAKKLHDEKIVKLCGDKQWWRGR